MDAIFEETSGLSFARSYSIFQLIINKSIIDLTD
jgi:hypothetical protein